MLVRPPLLAPALLVAAILAACGSDPPGAGSGARDRTASGDRIAFIRDTPSGGAGIWVVPARVDGRPVRVTGVDRPWGDLSWSPDGTQLAYVAAGGIHVIRVDGTSNVGITRPGAVSDPEIEWSPTGSHIAFARDGDVWVTTPDGESRQNLTRTPDVMEASPTWSPGASEIAFTREGDIWIMNVKSGRTRNLTSTPGILERHPDWSPDGSSFVFQGAEPGTIDAAGALFTMKVDGGARIQLTTPAQGFIKADWSPDGTLLTFTREGPGIGYMNPDGSGRVDLLGGDPAGEAASAWQPA